MVDVPGATPSELVLALGKDSNAYLLDRNNLGGITSPVAQASVSGINKGTSAVTYHTRELTYVAFHNDAGAIRAYQITATTPPAIIFAWSQIQNGRGSPWVTTIDNTSNSIVWGPELALEATSVCMATMATLAPSSMRVAEITN